MAAALVTAAVLSLAGLVASVVLGHNAGSQAELLRHTTFSIFATLITLLTHSMMMFYLIGKGRAVREAVSDAGLPTHPVSEISRLRRPVFSIGTLATTLTMATAILGGGVDTGAVPSTVHLVLAYPAVGANLAALAAEIRALAGSSRIVAEVNRQLAGDQAARRPDRR